MEQLPRHETQHFSVRKPLIAGFRASTQPTFCRFFGHHLNSCTVSIAYCTEYRESLPPPLRKLGSGKV